MSSSKALLSGMLADIASAVIATQRALDREADTVPIDGSLAPLAFIVRQTQLSFLGQLGMQGGASVSRDRVLTYSQVGRVQAALYGSFDTALTSRVSVSIQATEPKRAG